MELKKLIYRTCWIATGVLLATVVVGVVELGLLYTNTPVDWVILMYFLAILFLGLFIGVVLGRIAWDKVYVQGARGIKYTLEHSERMRDFEKKLFTDLKDFDIDKAMKWTVTIFLIFLMLVISACIAFRAVRFIENHFDTSGIISVIQQD